MGGCRLGRVAVVASLFLGLLGAVNPLGAGLAGAQGTDLGGLRRGVLYEAPEDADQRVDLYVLDEAPDGGALVSVSLDFSCDGSAAQRLLVTEVDGSGAIDIDTKMFGEVEEDISVTGTATLRGQVQADGTISGTVDVELRTDLKPPDHCTASAAPWASAPRPDPALDRIEAFIPLPKELAGARGTLGGMAFGDGALFLSGGNGGPTSLRRLDPTTAAIEWQVEIPHGGLDPRPVFGQGLVWVTDVKGADGDTIVAVDPTNGKRVGAVKGSDIAFAPDGTGWTVRDKGKTVRRVDAETHRVSDEYPFPEKLAPQVAASNDAVYVQVLKNRFDVVLTRLEPAAHRITAEAEPQIGDRAVRIDDDAVWTAGRNGVARFDPVTLSPLGADEEQGYYLLGALTAAPGLWLDDSSVFIYDEQLGLTEVPWLWGPLATDGTSVWVFDSLVGMVRLRAG